MVGNANANAIPFLKRRGIDVKAIEDSMVLWYDIKKQGAINETMKANPKLIDLSGNGHDATCYNFAWSGMSGVGGYNFTNFSELMNRFIYTKKENKFHFTEKLTQISNAFDLIGYIPNQDIRVKVSGLTDNRKVVFGVNNYIQVDNGESIVAMPEKATYPFGITGDAGTIDVTIEFLPLYPNALITDGVDDYIQITGLPLLTPEKGYTVIAKRKWLNIINEDNTCFASKRKTGVGSGDWSGAFQVERKYEDHYRIYSFGNFTVFDEFESSDIIYQNKATYCGKTISYGAVSDSDELNMCKWGSVSAWSGNIALYSFILFNRDLNIKEIDYVKQHYIES